MIPTSNYSTFLNQEEKTIYTSTHLSNVYNNKSHMKKNNYNQGWFKLLSFIFLCALGVVSASAQSTTTGAANTDWNTTTTWTGSSLPATNNSVTVSKAITINAAVVNTGFTITIASGGSITIGAAGFINAASITIQSGGSLVMTAAGVINLSGTLTTNSGGTYTAGAGAVNSYVYFVDNFTRATTSGGCGSCNIATVTGGGVPSVSYTAATTVATGNGKGIFNTTTNIQSSGTNGTNSYASATFPTATVSAPFKFTPTLSSNTGLVTWYCSFTPNASVRATVLSQVLASSSTSANSTTFISTNSGTSNVGYVVSVLTGISGTKYRVQLSSYAGISGTATAGVLATSTYGIDTVENFTAGDLINVKVTYNPFTQKWTLGAVSTGASLVDPTLSTYSSRASVSNSDYTGVAMNTFGFHASTAAANNYFFDNYYLMTTPIVNVTRSNTLTAPITPLTAMTGFTYVQSTSGPSATDSFYVNSGAIANPITVTVSNNTNWEISKDSTNATWGSTLTFTPASNVISSSITGKNKVYVRLKSGLSAANFTSDNITISSTGISTQTVSLSGSVTNITTPTALTVANNTNNRQYLTWGSVSSNILVFASTSNVAYIPSGDAATVYTGANAALGSASTFTSGANTYYLVAAGTGSNVEVTGLTNGTTYYYQVFSYSGSTYSSATAGTIANATTAYQTVTGFTASNASLQSVLAWTNPAIASSPLTQSNYWDEVMVIASTGSFTAPSGDGSSYTANAAFGTSGTSDGNGGFVVYKGTGSGVTVTGLTNFTNYNYSVYTRKGSVWTGVTSLTKMALPVSSLTTGDFVSTATGSYSTSSTWSVWNGSTLVASPCTISITSYTTPGSANNVWIAGGYTVTNSLSTNTNAPQAPSVFVATNSTSNANCNNLYVVNGSLVGTNGNAAQTTPTVIAATGPVNGIFVSGTDIQVGTNGTIGNSNLSPTSNGISFYIMNSGTTKIDNYASQTGGAFDAGRIIIFQNASGTPTLQISRSINLHYNGGAHGGSYALALQNSYNSGTSTTYTWTPNATITIDNGATVTMDKSCYLGNYISNTSVYPVNFTLNVNGTLTFTEGSGSSTPSAGSNNGFLTMGSTIANTGSAGTGCYLNIGSTGIITVPEFYPNGSNGVSSSVISTSYGRNTGINIASGGQLNISTVADFSVAGGQTFTGTGSINFSGTGTNPSPTVYLGSPAGLNAIMASGSKTFNGAATIYSFKAPSAWVNATAYLIGQQVTSNGNIYTITTAGTSGATAPSGTGTFTDNSVVYTCFGSAAQITGSSLPATIKGLILSNTAGITLSGATTVTDTLRQTSTVLTAASSAAVLTINSRVTPLPTFSSTNYIAGPLTLYSAANTSAQTINFPVGMNSEYLPLSLTLTQGVGTATAYTVVPTVGTATHGYVGSGNVQGVSSSRYYTISAADNTFTNGAISMSYSANDDDNTISLADATNIRIAQYTSGSNWTNLGGTGSANITGTITSGTTFTSLGQFAIGNQTVSQAAPTFGTASGATVSASYTVPYTLSSYDATWQTVLLSSGSITYGGTVLTKNTDYTVSGSGITFIPNSGSNAAVLRTSGTITILVAAPGYTTRTITQAVSPGTATKLAITTQPAPSATLDGVVLTTSPVIVVQDTYGNTVTTSTATITATVGSSSSPYFSLGGVTALSATSGVATFTGITTINRSATSVTGFITFTSAGLTSATSVTASGAGAPAMTIQQPTTYYWVGTPGGVQNVTGWGNSANAFWNTALNGSGTTPTGINSTDIYIVDGTNVGGTSPSTVDVTLTYTGNFSIGQLRIINNAHVTLKATTGATSTITISGANGGSSGDLYVAGGTSSLTAHNNSNTVTALQSGTTFVLASGGTFTIPLGSLTFATGSTATIGGTVNVASTGNGGVSFATGASATITGTVVLGNSTTSGTLIGVDAGSIIFNSGATCTVNSSNVNPFGTASSTPIAGIGSVVFANGSTMNYTKGTDIFAGTRKVVSFGNTSNFIDNNTSANSLLIDGNTFGNLTLNQSVSPTTPGANGFTCNNLTVNVGTFILAQTGTVTINGNVTIATGATLNASPASAVVINLNGTSAQTVTNSGTLTLSANTTLRANNAAGVNLGSSLTTLGTLSLVSGNFSVGSNTLTFANYSNTGGVLVATSGSSLSNTGSSAITLPSGISALTNLSNATGTMTIGNGTVVLSGNLVNGTGSILGSVSVTGNLTNSGSISGTVTVTGNLTNNSGGTMPGIITVGGNFVNQGTIAGTVTLNGSSVTAQSMTGTGNINNLTLNNSISGATIASGTQSLSGILTVTNGALNTGTKGIILKSTSIANSAVVAPVTGSIIGTVQVERFIPKGYRAYRDMAPQVYSTGSIFSNWQEAGSVTATTGIFITGTTSKDLTGAQYADYSAVTAATANPAPDATTGLDWSLNGNPSAYLFSNTTGTWNAGITNTKSTTLDPFQGVRVLVRGARDFNLYKTPIILGVSSNSLQMYNLTTLRATGSLITGDVTINTTNASGNSNGSVRTSTLGKLNGTTDTSFSLIANPYVAPVNWATVYGNSTGLNASYWYLDPTTTSTGSYLAYNALSGASSVDIYKSGGSSIPYTKYASSGFIQAGQAVFVQNHSSLLPTLKFTEDAKSIFSGSKVGVFGNTTSLSKIYVNLLKSNAGIYTSVDGAAAAFSPNFTNTYGMQDAKKLSAINDNLSINDKGRNLSIDGRLPAKSGDVLPINLSALSGTDYRLVIDATIYAVNGVMPYLVDDLNKTEKAIIGIDSVTFAADSKIAATYQNRFSIVFKPSTLSVNTIVVSATANGIIATINWNTVGEKGVSKFELEKSTDGSIFTKIGEESAKNTVSATYVTTDNSATAATNYYRVKAVSTDGNISYSNIAKVACNKQLTTFKIFPNPLTGKTLNVQLGNLVAGKYMVIIINSLGQKVAESTLVHAGGNATQVLNIKKAIATGVYNIVFKEVNSKQLVFQSTLSVQ